MERSLGPGHLCSPHGEPAESAWMKEACCWGGIREAGYHTDWRGESVLVGETRPVAREHPASLLCSVARGWAAEMWRAGDCWFWPGAEKSMVVAVARRSVLVAMSASGGSSAVERRYPSRPGQHRSKQSCANRSRRFRGFATEDGYGFVGGMMCV